MSLKPRYKKRIIWSAVSLCGCLIMAYIIIPSTINLDRLKPKIAATITERTGMPVTINGPINISLLGHITIVAHDVSISYGNISEFMFSIPLRYIFNLDNAPLNQDISVYDGKFSIDTLTPAIFKYNVNIYNSGVDFLGKTYDIIRGTMNNGNFNGTIRTDQHKYDISFNNGDFIVKNYNNNLDINGILYPDGSARGNLYIETDNVNRWFDFNEPKIPGKIILNTNFSWDGKYGFEFTELRTNHLTGSIVLYPDGRRDINLRSNNLTYDLSFLKEPNNLFFETKYYVDFYGNLHLGNNDFKHVLVDAIGSNDSIKINKVIIDNIKLLDGTISTDGAKNVNLSIDKNNHTTTCLFSGTPTNWTCEKFSYDNISGIVSFDGKTIRAIISSPNKIPPIETFRKAISSISDNAIIDFSFSDQAGILTLNKSDYEIVYRFAQNVSLNSVGIDIQILPEFMRQEQGNLTTENSVLTFVPKSQNWTISITKHSFNLTGKNFKNLLSGTHLDWIRNIPYVASGTYDSNNIANLNILIGGHVFSGSATKNALTLTTDLLDIDTFLNSDFIENFEEQSFIYQHPVISLFDLPVSISLSANKMLYNGTEYNNFTYNLKPDIQNMSITDNNRGNLLTTISKTQTDYKIDAQLNKFLFDGNLLPFDSPINLRNTTITGDIQLNTFGKIATDIIYNLSGDIDLTFSGGDFIGFDVDNFYASAPNLPMLDAEYAISNALSGGFSILKKMHIIGKYKNKNFATTVPATIALKHTDITSVFNIANNQFNGNFDITLRGTSPEPTPIQLTVYPDNSRKFSLSEIMMNFDSGFMHTFVQTHEQF